MALVLLSVLTDSEGAGKMDSMAPSSGSEFERRMEVDGDTGVTGVAIVMCLRQDKICDFLGVP